MSDREHDDDLSALRALGPLARTLEPLPGGLDSLRERIQRRPRFRRAYVALAMSAACAAMAIVWLSRPLPEAPDDRRAMQRLLTNDGQPNPRAVAMGLVAPVSPIVAGDPRIAPSDDVVFYWVPPARPAAAEPQTSR